MDLFLAEQVDPRAGSEDAARARVSLLRRLEEVIGSVISSGGRHEARLWLCSTISALPSVTPRSQLRLFADLLKRGRRSSRRVAEQLLRMVFETRPEKAGSIVAGMGGDMLESFFEGNPRRILQWFDHFASTSEAGHKKGARALSQFAFANRDICWEELEWKGKHGQSPAVVATKPHYFHDLDVLRTIENFLEHMPEFWSSDEFAASVRDGEILQIDMQFFIEKFLFLMYEQNSEDIWAMVDEFLLETKFSSLSQRLLILLDESELHSVLVFLSKCNNGCLVHNLDHLSSWLEALLVLKNEVVTFSDFLLLNALITRGRQLLHLLLDDEYEKEHQEIAKLLQSNAEFSVDDHYSLMTECMKVKLQMAMKWAALQSWIVHFILHKECRTEVCFESLFARNGIGFKRSGYSLLLPDGFSRTSVFEQSKSKRYREKKKRKRMLLIDKVDVSEMSFQDVDMHSPNITWFLSTDNYSTSWTIIDLPEHLSQHCFRVWMKWILSQQSWS